MRCLGFAELDREVTAREFDDPDAPASDELHSDYVVSDHLQLSTWARDAVALELPDQILCRRDCAGLCPTCGKDLNVEPHEHQDRELDPRWAALEGIRDELYAPWRSPAGPGCPQRGHPGRGQPLKPAASRAGPQRESAGQPASGTCTSRYAATPARGGSPDR